VFVLDICHVRFRYHIKLQQLWFYVVTAERNLFG